MAILVKISNFIYLAIIIGCVIWMRVDYQTKLDTQMVYIDSQLKGINGTIINSEEEYALLYKKTSDSLVEIKTKLDIIKNTITLPKNKEK